jgi:hypothetical protein
LLHILVGNGRFQDVLGSFDNLGIVHHSLSLAIYAL